MIILLIVVIELSFSIPLMILSLLNEDVARRAVSPKAPKHNVSYYYYQLANTMCI